MGRGRQTSGARARDGRERADEAAVRCGLASDRDEASRLILAGEILREPDGFAVSKPGETLPAGTSLRRRTRRGRYASRAGLKLEGALDAFCIDVRGRSALDVGASTGGFTDCLLARGAAHVTALDVGRGLIAEHLRRHPSVTLLESVNARTLPPDVVPGPFDVVTADVSFISLRLLLPVLAPRLGAGGDMLLLVKPQFEAPKELVGPGGIVTDPATIAAAVAAVRDAAASCGLHAAGEVDAAVRGAKGNREVVLWLRRHGQGGTLLEP